MDLISIGCKTIHWLDSRWFFFSHAPYLKMAMAIMDGEIITLCMQIIVSHTVYILPIWLHVGSGHVCIYIGPVQVCIRMHKRLQFQCVKHYEKNYHIIWSCETVEVFLHGPGTSWCPYPPVLHDQGRQASHHPPLHPGRAWCTQRSQGSWATPPLLQWSSPLLSHLALWLAKLLQLEGGGMRL